MEELRPNGQRAKNAILLIWIVLAINVVSLVSNLLQYNLLHTVGNGGFITPDEANANDSTQQIIAIIFLIVYIISAVTFIQWFRRAYYNLHLKVGHYLSHNEGWAAGGWFVPIVCLYRPIQIMRELYDDTALYLSGKGIKTDKNLTNKALTPWWTLWIVSSIMGQFIYRYDAVATSIDELINSTIANIIMDIIGIPLALITIKIIKDYSQVEPLLIETKENEEEPQPAELLVESN
ncbi:DUF4328 domain-containing protein [Flavobacterium sp. F-65]|uniref:DUF4328 domain-containing protein n=1 Tax=Flavobacterium pisciphilum TaxID=2893755 RepID=A0ABS8MP35_9FLAO|nr:DUF4328 domain-containing protein [Flavobacterium sp. F-65]MCC9070408.1 DUF4328 domain-containing protein [Flavobacterium sp. F-65]